MSAAHTPGPWRLDPAESAHVIEDAYHVIEGGVGFVGGREAGLGIAGCMSLADARLIAAAPELLALARMVTMLRRLGGVLPGVREMLDELVKDADAAIAKATGATSPTQATEASPPKPYLIDGDEESPDGDRDQEDH